LLLAIILHVEIKTNKLSAKMINRIAIKEEDGINKLYEVYFNNSKNNFDRVSATSKKEAESKMRKMYPIEKVTSSRLIG
jgi:hypothetical protein